MDHSTLFIILACVIGFAMTWGVGANDLANIVSTAMGSKSISLKQVIIITIIFELAGAFFGGVQVTDTIRGGIINTQALDHSPELIVYGMLSVLLAGSTWMLLASYFGLPVSITHTIIGSIVGFGSLVLGNDAIYWHQVIAIGISWLTSPLLAGTIAYFLFVSIQRLILVKKQPYHYAKRYAPFYLLLIGIAFALASIIRCLNHIGFTLSPLMTLMISFGSGIFVMLIGMLLIRRIKPCKNDNRHTQFANAEKIFAVLVLFTACAMVFAHGSNDISIAVGPMATVYNMTTNGTKQILDKHIPYWIILLACTGVISGLLMYGKKVITTVGKNITVLTPSRAFVATLSASFTVVIATGTGIPVSTTQTLVGAVLGVGIARGIGALNLIVVRNIFMSWVVTIPVAATFAILYFLLFQNIFGH